MRPCRARARARRLRCQATSPVHRLRATRSSCAATARWASARATSLPRPSVVPAGVLRTFATRQRSLWRVVGATSSLLSTATPRASPSASPSRFRSSMAMAPHLICSARQGSRSHVPSSSRARTKTALAWACVRMHWPLPPGIGPGGACARTHGACSSHVQLRARARAQVPRAHVARRLHG